MRPIARPLRTAQARLHIQPTIQGVRSSVSTPHRSNTVPVLDSRSSLRTRSYVTTRSTSPVKSSNHLESDPGTCTSLSPCPYVVGTRLTLQLQTKDSSSNTLIDVVVIHAHSPFTLAQSMLVQRTQPHPTLPSHFVLKIADPRFAEPDVVGLNRKPGWTELCEDAFNRGLSKTRAGEWFNFWQCLGAATTTSPLDVDLDVDQEQDDWIEEMDRWYRLRQAIEIECEAYRALRALQGSEIPKFYGSCTVLLHRTTPNLDPFVGNVPGMLLQYIEGTSLDRLTLGKDLSVSDADRVSQGALAALRKIRDALVIHGDFAARNIIVRPHDLDHPVLIDFGSARTNLSGTYTRENWIEVIVNEREVLRARDLFRREGLHNPSPMPEYYDDIAAHKDLRGYMMFNGNVEALRPDWRDQYYEPIHDVPPDKMILMHDGSRCPWVYPRWRIKSGVNTANASADYAWGKKKPKAP